MKISNKKTILILAFAIATLTPISCNKKAATETATEQEGRGHKNEEAQNLAYECPMDCEKGKTYETEGKCPVCKMDLIEVKTNSHKGHDHSEEGNGKENHEGHNR